jgi:hypothetical protein
MNIAQLEVDYDLVAKTCVCKGRQKKVTFSFVDSAHSLRIKTTLLSQRACQSLLKYTRWKWQDHSRRWNNIIKVSPGFIALKVQLRR